MRPLGIPPGYRSRASDSDFLGHLGVMETLSLADGAQRPWNGAVVIEDTTSRRAAEQAEWFAEASRVPRREVRAALAATP